MTWVRSLDPGEGCSETEHCDDGVSDFDELNDDNGGFAAECTLASLTPPTHLDPFNPDDDGDGIGNFIDNDDDADGLPDPDDEAVRAAAAEDDNDDPDKCEESNDEVTFDCVVEILLAIEADKGKFLGNEKLDRLRELLENNKDIADEALNALCDSDDDCGLDERCTWATCTEDVECTAENDSDGDGLCDGDDINPNGDLALDDDGNGIPDNLEAKFGDDEGVEEPDEEDDDDHSVVEGLEGTGTGDEDIEDGGGLPEEPDGGGDEGQEGPSTGGDNGNP